MHTLIIYTSHLTTPHLETRTRHIYEVKSAARIVKLLKAFDISHGEEGTHLWASLGSVLIYDRQTDPIIPTKLYLKQAFKYL